MLAAGRLINHGGARSKADWFGDCYGWVGERRCWLVPGW